MGVGLILADLSSAKTLVARCFEVSAGSPAVLILPNDQNSGNGLPEAAFAKEDRSARLWPAVRGQTDRVRRLGRQQRPGRTRASSSRLREQVEKPADLRKRSKRRHRSASAVPRPCLFEGDVPCAEWNINPEDASVDGREVEISFSSAFSSKGWSGGPLFGWVNGDPHVVGIMRGVQHHDYWLFGSDDDTVFTGGNLMVDLVKHGLSNWPA